MRTGHKQSMNKAKQVGKPYCDKRDIHAFYCDFEYRGHIYSVRYAGWFEASDETPRLQHLREQERIDKIIENESKPEKTYHYEDTAAFGFELFWAFVENDEEKYYELLNKVDNKKER